jgi:hypothetical protein
MTKLTNPLKSAIRNRKERFSRMRRQNAPMLTTGATLPGPETSKTDMTEQKVYQHTIFVEKYFL